MRDFTCFGERREKGEWRKNEQEMEGSKGRVEYE